MLFAVAMLAVYACYSFWTAYTEQSWLHLILGALSAAACVGTTLLRKWSQHLVYALTVSFVGGWLYSVYAGASVGFYDIFFASRGDAVRSLAPGIALVVFSCATSLISYGHFRGFRATR